MVGDLITLPLRVGVRATTLWLRATEQTVAVLADATGRLIDSVVSREPPPTRFERETAHEPYTSHAPARPPLADHGAAEPEPAHITEQPELVGAVADPGAEGGAGATVHVREPWEGYKRMRADDVVDRIAAATTAELAAIELFETAGKRRVTVLEAVERQLRVSHGSG